MLENVNLTHLFSVTAIHNFQWMKITQSVNLFIREPLQIFTNLNV